MQITERPHIAARRCLGRLLDRKPYLWNVVDVGTLRVKHVHVRRSGYWRVVTQDWEGVLAEVLHANVAARQDQLRG